MEILLIGTDLTTPQMTAVLEEEHCFVRCFGSREFADRVGDLAADAAIIGRDHGHHDDLPYVQSLETIPLRIAIGPENIASGISTLSAGDNALCCRYILYGGEENLRRLVRYIRHKLYGSPLPPPPEEQPFDSLYTLSGKLYGNTEQYIREEEQGYDSYVGILSYRSRWQSGDMAVEHALIREFHQRNIGVLPVFSTGKPDEALGCLSMDETIRRFFADHGKSRIELLINFIFFGVSGEKGDTLFERAVETYAGLNVPVLHPVQSSRLTNDQWKASAAPFDTDSALNFDTAEMQGMIEPVFLGGSLDRDRHEVEPERVQKLADRAAAWIALRKKPWREKHLAVILNNAVCSGVEATLGRASGLSSFESAVKVLRELGRRGFVVDGLPENGNELREMFLEKRAFSDFRWTPAEEIRDAGGVVYAMPAEEYRQIYDGLSEQLRTRIEETWGPPPGEAMVLDDRILITGIRFGNVLVMIQPKRGCYGAKCTGEVCKILQDPACPPTHQFLATYFYGAKVFGADAFLHFGTHGSLEFLPGKASGLGPDCFPDAALGDRPNIYLYNAASVAPAMLAKRRSYGVIVDHAAPKEGLHTLDDVEIDALCRALSGEFVRPGEGGTHEDHVETGRNLYGVQIDRIPTEEAWLRGKNAAEELVCRCLAEEGQYPRQIALSMVSLDIPRTGGEQLAMFMGLLGVRPVRNGRGSIERLERIPLDELGRPRMDVSAQISGILRDTWPDVLRRMDEAVMLAASADETPESNFVIKDLEEDAVDGVRPPVARIFGGAPGTYTNSIGLALKASAWKNETDLARYFVDSSCYVYSGGRQGEKDLSSFLAGVRRTDAACSVMSVRHTDGMRSSYASRIQGGYALATKMLGKKKPVRCYMGESGADGVGIKSLDEHLRDSLAKTLMDENWRKKQMEQGYDGAAEIMQRIQNVFDMQCVGGSFSDDTLDELVKRYGSSEVQSFLRENNPYAAEECGRRFLELAERKKWRPGVEAAELLQREYLKAEGRLEDGLSGKGEIQGGSVDVISDSGQEQWKTRLRETDKEIERWKKQSC